MKGILRRYCLILIDYERDAMTFRKPCLRAAAIAAAIVALPAPAAEYSIDPEHTFPSLEFSHMGISVWRGKFNTTSGTVTYDAEAKTGRVDITVDTASIDFGHDGMNEHARNEEWLNVEKYPAMTYQGELIFKDGEPVGVDGQLTLLGVTKPVALTIDHFKCIEHPYYKKPVCGADASGRLDRADFGLTQYTDDGMGLIDFNIQVEAMKDDGDDGA